MKKRTKLMLVLLSSAMVAASAAGIAGCKKDKTPTVDETYKSYVAYAEANNQEVLSYDEWIQAILGASKPGPEGPAGPAGPAGEAAEPIGIESVEIRDGKLVLIFTDGSEKEAELPDQITHVHTYDEKNVNVLIPVTEDSDGLGYIVCKDEGCGHVEVVVMKRSYDITVKMGGQPVAGIDVVINGTTATTDANGVAQIMNFGEFNDYLVSIGTPGYSTAQLYRTGLRFGVAMEIEINKSFVENEETDEYGQKNYFVEINGAGDYVVDLETAESAGTLAVSNKEFRLYGGETEAKYYKISSSSPYFSLQNAEYYGSELTVGGEVIFALQPGETKKVYLAANALALSQAQHTAGENVMYPVKVEEIEAPAVGSKWNPAIVAANEFMTLPAATEADGWVYYKWTNFAADIGTITITIEGAEVEFYTKTYNWGMGTLSDNPPTNVVSDTQFNIANDSDAYAMAPFTIRARATGSGEHKFKLNISYPLGSLPNPETLAIGTKVYTGVEEEYTSSWAKIQVATTGLYAIEQSGILYSASYKFVEGVPENDNPTEDEGATEVSVSMEDDYGNPLPSVTLFKLEAGKEYYIRVQFYATQENSTSTVTLRAYNPSTDIGLHPDAPVAINVDLSSGSASYDVGDEFKGKDFYLSFAAPEDGTLTLPGSIGYGGSSAFFGSGISTQQAFEEGDTVLVRVHYESWDSDLSVHFGWATKQTGSTGEGPGNEDPDDPPAPQPQVHSFTVVDDTGAPVSGVIVTVNGVSSAATGADGVAQVETIPGAYAIELSGYDTDTYYYEIKERTINGLTSGYELVLRTDKQTYSFALKSGGEALNISGATLKVMNGRTVLASVPVTNGRASATVYFPSTASRLSYELELTDEQKQNYSLPNGVDFQFAEDADQADIEITLVANSEYTVSLVNGNGNAVSGVGVQLSYGSKPVANGTTDANGTVNLKAVPLSGSEKYVVKFVNVPSGFRIPDGELTATATSISATMLEGDNEATGSEWLNYNFLQGESQTVLTNGNNVINNPQAESGYVFTASAPGRYTFAVRNTDNTSYISFLGVMQGYTQKDYIRNGKQVYSAKNLVLGAKREYNQTYELSIDLTAGDIVIIGYHTGTEDGGNGNIIVTANIAPGTTAIHSGTNTVTLVDGSAMAFFSHDYGSQYSYGYEITFEWTGDVTVTIDGEVCESGETIDGSGGGVVELVITSSTAASVTVTVTVTGNSGYGGY